MLNAIVTPINFNRFAKRLKKISHENSIEISLSSSQEILSKTLGFKNQFELKKQFIDESVHFIEINENKYSYFLDRFTSLLECEPEKSKKIFDNTFSLFKKRNGRTTNRIEDIFEIIKKITILSKSDTSIQKLMITHVKDLIRIVCASYNKNMNYNYDSHIEQKTFENDNKEDLKHYGNIKEERISIASGIFSSIYKEQYLTLLNDLFSYTDSEIKEGLTKNKEFFMYTNQICTFLKYEHEKLIFPDGLIYEKNYFLVHKDDIDISKYDKFPANDKYSIIPNKKAKELLKGEPHEKIKAHTNKNLFRSMHSDNLKLLLLKVSKIINIEDFRIMEIYSTFEFGGSRYPDYYDDNEYLYSCSYPIKEAIEKAN